MKTREKFELTPAHRKALEIVLPDMDGHTIFEPELFLNAGIDPAFVARVTQEHFSDGSIKGSIFDDKGEVMASLKGVYGLEFLREVARDLDVQYHGAFGRGSEARNIVEALRDHLEVTKVMEGD